VIISASSDSDYRSMDEIAPEYDLVVLGTGKVGLWLHFKWFSTDKELLRFDRMRLVRVCLGLRIGSDPSLTLVVGS